MLELVAEDVSSWNWMWLIALHGRCCWIRPPWIGRLLPSSPLFVLPDSFLTFTYILPLKHKSRWQPNWPPLLKGTVRQCVFLCVVMHMPPYLYMCQRMHWPFAFLSPVALKTGLHHLHPACPLSSLRCSYPVINLILQQKDRSLSWKSFQTDGEDIFQELNKSERIYCIHRCGGNKNCTNSRSKDRLAGQQKIYFNLRQLFW